MKANNLHFLKGCPKVNGVAFVHKTLFMSRAVFLNPSFFLSLFDCFFVGNTYFSSSSLGYSTAVDCSKKAVVLCLFMVITVYVDVNENNVEAAFLGDLLAWQGT